MNTLNLIGNVSKVPHFIAGNENKKAVAYLTVANNDVREKTIFIEVTVFGREAEYVNQNISTGARVAIEGIFDRYIKDKIMLNKYDFITKLDSNYLFKSCGWLHEKVLKSFTFTTEKILKDIITIKDKKFIQTSIFDFIN